MLTSETSQHIQPQRSDEYLLMNSFVKDEFSFTLWGSSWSKNWIDMKQINRRKDQSLIMYH